MTERRTRPTTIHRIAIFRALHLGDLLVAVPALRALRRTYPGAEITFIGLPWAGDLARRFGALIDRYEVFPGFPGIAERSWEAGEVGDFLKAAQERRYDLAVQLHGDGRASNTFVALLGACWSIGHRPTGSPATLAPLDATLEWAPVEHQVHRWLRLARLAGASDGDRSLAFPVEPADRIEADLPELAGVDALAVVHPGSRSPARRWPVERFAETADALTRRYGLQVALVGGPEEAAITGAVAARMRVPAVDLAGRLSLGGLAALLERAAIFVGNDSGPAHLAAAVGTPSVTIFTSVDPAEWAPLDRLRHRVLSRSVGCDPCGHWTCPIDHRCATAIDPYDVLAAVERLLPARDRPVPIGDAGWVDPAAPWLAWEPGNPSAN